MTVNTKIVILLSFSSEYELLRHYVTDDQIRFNKDKMISLLKVTHYAFKGNALRTHHALYENRVKMLQQWVVIHVVGLE